MQVVELTQDDEDGYRRFLARTPAALFYHSLPFRDFLLRLLGCQARYATVVDAREIVGAMPLMAAEGPYGTVFNSLPYFGSNGGVLGSLPEARALLAEWYEAQVAGEGLGASTVIANPLDPEPSPPLPHDFLDERVGHVTPLSGSGNAEELVLGLIDGSARRNVQKATRSGVTVDMELDGDGLAVLERLHAESMAAIGGRSKTSDFFKLLPDYFRPEDDYGLYVARVDGGAVAALLVFYFGQTVEYYVPATDVEFRPLQPMAAILHRAMTDAAARGFRNWNWGGSWTGQESLIRFKGKWGGRPNGYRYFTRVTRRDILAASPEQLLDAYPGFYVVPFSALEAASPAG